MQPQDDTAQDRGTTGARRGGMGADLRRRLAALGGWLMHAINSVKRHPNRWVRWGAAACLIAGGFLGFLPVLGLWMLPLGLVIISDEVGWLRRPRRRITVWLVSRYKRWRWRST